MIIRAGSLGIKSTRELWDDDFDVYEVDDDEWDEKGRNMISNIYVAYDEIIRSIQFGYWENGAQVLSPKYGPSEGFNFRVISFVSVRLKEDEYVTGLSGVVDVGRGIIRNLTFHTNRGTHGPIGHSSDDNPSGSKMEIDPAICCRGEFGGFFGSHARYHLSYLRESQWKLLVQK